MSALDLSHRSTLYSNFSPFTAAIQNILYVKGITVAQKQKIPFVIQAVDNGPAFTHNNFLVYGTIAIVEYLSECFPDPPILPLDPPTRAIHRMLLNQIITDWYGLAEGYNRLALVKLFNESAKAYEETPYFVSHTVQAIDCFLYPLLLEIRSEPGRNSRIKKYTQRLQKFFTPPTDLELLDLILCPDLS